MMIYHGTSDPIFSSDDTRRLVRGAARAATAAMRRNFARLYRVPGMNHCCGGPATDQFDMLTPLVNWVEQGEAPDSVRRRARAAPATPAARTPTCRRRWSPTRTRPLCPYPKVARYNGSGSLELASSFTCQ